MDQSFERLDRRSQIRLLRSLACTALTAYDLPTPRLTLLRHRHNTVFRVDTADGQRYVLRIHRAGTPTVESVGAELAWLAALRRDTTLEAPAPVPTRDGPLLTVAAAPSARSEGTRPHICVLFRWLDGRHINAGLAPAHLELAGELMAHLQDHAARFGPPQPFARGRVDSLVESARRLPDSFAPEVIAACQALVASTLSVEEAEQVTAVVERVCAAQQALGQCPATFGLMHADLHHHNLLFARGAVRAIDFDDSGFGPLLYDLAVPLAELQDRAAYPALRTGLLAGYRRVRPLPPAHEACLDTFIALRRVQDTLWVLGARRHPAIGPDWAAQARRRMAPLAGFLAEGGRFPECNSDSG
jgi:Ser/Thr protein kinase RdoA (MazF antagonist)